MTPEQENEKVIESNEAKLPYNHTYGNTTFGYEVNLPDGWVACERPSVAPVVRFHKSTNCNDWGESYISVSQETSAHYPKKLTAGQNLKDWIDGEITDENKYSKTTLINEEKLSENSYIVEKSTGQTSVYLTLPNRLVLLLSPEGESDSKTESLLVAKQLSGSFHDEPVTTGDVTGLVSWTQTGADGSVTSSVYADYHGDILNPKTMQKIASFVTDESGVYLIRLLPGDYLLTFGKTKKSVHATSGQLTRIDDQTAPK